MSLCKIKIIEHNMDAVLYKYLLYFVAYITDIDFHNYFIQIYYYAHLHIWKAHNTNQRKKYLLIIPSLINGYYESLA